MFCLILSLNLDQLFPFLSLRSIHRSLFLSRLVVSPQQLKLLPLLIDLLKGMTIHWIPIYLGGLLRLLNQLDIMWVISPPIDILIFRSSRLVLYWWLVFLRLVILILCKQKRRTWMGVGYVDKKWFSFEESHLGFSSSTTRKNEMSMGL